MGVTAFGGPRAFGPGMAAEDLPRNVAFLRGRDSGEITVRRLQVFWAVAHARSLTRAAKLLGVTQPSLSQQLAAFEAALGFALFLRRSNAMEPTEAGRALLGKAEAVLRTMQDFEEEVALLGDAPRQTLRVAGIASVMKLVVPRAMSLLADPPGTLSVDYDLHEAAPAEILDLLAARRISVGLIGAGSLTEAGSGFHAEPILSDRQFLVVPKGIALDSVTDPDTELDPAAQAVLGRTVQFAFGTGHAERVQAWFDAILPGNRLIARTRSFELVVGMVREGLGIGVVPALSILGATGPDLSGVTLYETGLPARRIVALVPAHYRRAGPHQRFLQALQTAGAAMDLPSAGPVPPFVRARVG